MEQLIVNTHVNSTLSRLNAEEMCLNGTGLATKNVGGRGQSHDGIRGRDQIVATLGGYGDRLSRGQCPASCSVLDPA